MPSLRLWRRIPRRKVHGDGPRPSRTAKIPGSRITDQGSRRKRGWAHACETTARQSLHQCIPIAQSQVDLLSCKKSEGRSVPGRLWRHVSEASGNCHMSTISPSFMPRDAAMKLVFTCSLVTNLSSSSRVRSDSRNGVRRQSCWREYCSFYLVSLESCSRAHDLVVFRGLFVNSLQVSGAFPCSNDTLRSVSGGAIIGVDLISSASRLLSIGPMILTRSADVHIQHKSTTRRMDSG